MCKRQAPGLAASVALLLAIALQASAQTCPDETLQLYTGGGSAVCPCFAAGELAGAILQAPAEHYPIEILRVGFGWGSQYGGTPQQMEEALRIYAGGLPNPGAPIFSLDGPVLTDGAVNEFNLEPLPGAITIASGPFTVALEFMTGNAGNIYAPSMVHDANGCTPAKNVVYAIPGGWLNACALGVTGDWIVYALYRPTCLTGVGDPLAGGDGVYMLGVTPNPTHGRTEFSFGLGADASAAVSVHDLRGRLVADLSERFYPAGSHRVLWNGRDASGRALPAGVYFVQVVAGGKRSVEKVVVLR